LEQLPFVEGYARSGQVEDAYQLTQQVKNQSPALRPALCAIWQRTLDEKKQTQQPLGQNLGDDLLNALAHVNADIGCSIK
jgi:hypothetical protein